MDIAYDEFFDNFPEIESLIYLRGCVYCIDSVNEVIKGKYDITIKRCKDVQFERIQGYYTLYIKYEDRAIFLNITFMSKLASSNIVVIHSADYPAFINDDLTSNDIKSGIPIELCEFYDKIVRPLILIPVLDECS